MQIEIKIDIPELQIQSLAQQAANQYLKTPETWRGGQGGSGYQLIATQVKQVVSEMDFTGIIKEVVAKSVNATVEEVTINHIKKLANKTVKTMHENGTLI